MLTCDELSPVLGEKFRRAFDDIFAPDRRGDDKEETHGNKENPYQDRGC
jgi:hypothetical protein